MSDHEETDTIDIENSAELLRLFQNYETDIVAEIGADKYKEHLKII